MSRSINKIILVGNVGRDPDVQTTARVPRSRTCRSRRAGASRATAARRSARSGTG
jgi:single-stranded DNA-binding protein